MDKSTYYENLTLIQNARRGSDVFGVLERAAYNRYIRTGDDREWENWFSAQQRFAKYEVPLNFDNPGRNQL
jgi:hypothetical protein